MKRNHGKALFLTTGLTVCAAAGVAQVFVPPEELDKEGWEERADELETMAENAETNGSSELNQEAWEDRAREAEKSAREAESEEYQ